MEKQIKFATVSECRNCLGTGYNSPYHYMENLCPVCCGNRYTFDKIITIEELKQILGIKEIKENEKNWNIQKKIIVIIVKNINKV